MFILFFSISFVSLVATLFILCIIPLWDSAPAHSPSCKKLKPSSQEDACFSGRCTSAYIFTSSCVIPLWDSATAHPPSSKDKELNPSSQEDACFSGHCTSAYNFHFILGHPSLALSNSTLTLWKRALNPSSQEDARFSGRWTSTCIVHFSLRHPSLGLSNSSLILR